MVETLADAQADVKAETLFNTLIDESLAEAKAKTLGHTLGNVGDDALVKTLADTLEVEVATLLAQTGRCDREETGGHAL